MIRQKLLLTQHVHQKPTVPWQNTGANPSSVAQTVIQLTKEKISIASIYMEIHCFQVYMQQISPKW